MNKFLTIADRIIDLGLVTVFFASTWFKKESEINYLEWIAVILCFILLKLNRMRK